jgi:hypothetical protein
MPTAVPDFDSNATVCCRPPVLNWVFVVLCAPTGVMMWFGAHSPNKAGSPSASDVAIVQAIAVALLLMVAVLAAWQTRARIVADAGGLRWRLFGGWKSARWEEVWDFYDRLPSQAQGQRSLFWAVIKTAAGGVRFSNDWTDAIALREQVARLATNAAMQQWDLLGSRPCDLWPRVFRYDTWQNIWTPRVLLKLALTALGYLLTPPLQQAMSQAGQVGWGVTLAGLGVYVLLIASMGAFFLMPLAQYRAAGRRKAERITADLNGIVFEDGARRVEAAWADVTGYGIGPGPGAFAVRYVVETRQGDFDFLATLSDATLLQAIIRRYAEDAGDKEWRARVDPEVLGGEAARWSGGRVGVGARVYHYRKRANRAVLWAPLVFGLTCGFLSWAAWQGLLPGAQAAGLVCVAVGCGLVFLGGWYAYRVRRMETDEDGLTWITPLGRRRLAWGQVEDYWLIGEYNNGIVQGRGERLGFSRGIVGYEELKEEIARLATECGGKAWERRATMPAPNGRRRGRRGPGSSARG